MKKLLSLFILLTLYLTGNAQELNVPKGREFAITTNSLSRGTYNGQTNTTYLFKSLGRTPQGDNIFECRLTRVVQHQEANSELFIIDTDSLKKTNFNHYNVFNYLALLQKPFKVIISKKGKIIRVDGLDEILEDVYLKWQPDPSIKHQVAKTTDQVPRELQDVFLQMPDQPLDSSLKWKDNLGVTYEIRDEKKIILPLLNSNNETKAVSTKPSTIAITSKKEGDFYEQGSLTVDPQTGLIVSSTRNKGYDYNISSVKQTGKTTFIQQLKTDVSYKKADTAWINMVVKLHRSSEAFKTNNKYDMNKMLTYFKKKDVEFAKDPHYHVNKLSMLQNLGPETYEDTYYSVLLATPSKYLYINDTHVQLFNKILKTSGEDPHAAYDVAKYFYKENFYSDFLQNTFSQNFISTDSKQSEPREWKSGIALLKLLNSDKSRLMQQKSEALYYWALTQDQPSSSVVLLDAASKLSEMDDATMKAGNGGRYTLLIYKKLLEKNRNKEADVLLMKTIQKLKRYAADTLNQNRFNDKNILAYAYYLKYQAAKKAGDAKSLEYLSAAAQYSPRSETEKSISNQYDRHFLKSKLTYRDEFIETLFSSGNEAQALNTLILHISAEPESLPEMKKLYEAKFPAGNFKLLFHTRIVPSWEKAPPFNLKDINDKDKSSEDFKGKWVVVDFWGTWCGPCVAEMPVINEFNKEIKEGKHSGISLLTIACKDYPQTVEPFLKENGYDIPVIISDGEIEYKYKVNGFPQKVIISPEGKMLSIEHGKDWRAIVKNFKSLD